MLIRFGFFLILFATCYCEDFDSSAPSIRFYFLIRRKETPTGIPPVENGLEQGSIHQAEEKTHVPIENIFRLYNSEVTKFLENELEQKNIQEMEEKTHVPEENINRLDAKSEVTTLRENDSKQKNIREMEKKTNVSEENINRSDAKSEGTKLQEKDLKQKNIQEIENKIHGPDENMPMIDGNTHRANKTTHQPNENSTNIEIVVWALSILVLIVNSFIAYAYLPGMERIRKFILMSHIISLFVAFIGFFVFRVGYVDAPRLKNLRIISAYSTIFPFLASYFWISAMCFDIWWTFGLSYTLYNRWKNMDRERFIVYSVYVWGSALIVTSICLTVDYTNGIFYNFPKPQLGLHGCWFEYGMAKIFYFYGPITLTMFFNIILYSLCVLKSRRKNVNLSNHIMHMDTQRRQEDDQSLNFFSILFIIIIINCSTEIIWSSLCHSETSS